MTCPFPEVQRRLAVTGGQVSQSVSQSVRDDVIAPKRRARLAKPEKVCRSRRHPPITTQPRSRLRVNESRDGHDDDHSIGGAQQCEVFRAPNIVLGVLRTRLPANQLSSSGRDPWSTLGHPCGRNGRGRQDLYQDVQAPRTHRCNQGTSK